MSGAHAWGIEAFGVVDAFLDVVAFGFCLGVFGGGVTSRGVGGDGEGKVGLLDFVFFC